MKFGVREICDVVLKAKAPTTIGKKKFYANEPVIYFDTLKTSSMEGAATTVYAQGGRGNSRLVAWEGERTVTFTMEDALISPEGFMILSGAGLIEAGGSTKIYQHITETVDKSKVKISATTVDSTTTVNGIEIQLSEKPVFSTTATSGNLAYVMFVKDGEIISEPYIPDHNTAPTAVEISGSTDQDWKILIKKPGENDGYKADHKFLNAEKTDLDYDAFDSVIVDYYTERTSGAKQIEITADKFGGNYYLEASTLFRDQNGVDMPAEFIIPNCKIQSNFTFTMASSGDPSTFTFTMDAFPDYTRFDHSKKVLAAIQIIEDSDSDSAQERTLTDHSGNTLEDFTWVKKNN